jgi:hypothetical protein
LDTRYPEIQDQTVSDMDICLYDQEQNHIHYIELKNDLNNGRKDKARKQIQKAYTFWNDLNYTLSATEIYLEEAKKIHHPILENKEKTKSELEEAISNSKTPLYAGNRLLEPETREEDLVDIDIPIDNYGEKLHPDYSVEEQIKKRFNQPPSQEEVQIAIYSHKKQEVLLMRLNKQRLFST